MVTGISNGLTGVWGTSSSDVFAVGLLTILHYDGNVWSPMVSSDSLFAIEDVWGFSPTNVFAAGGGAIIHYDGSVWDYAFTSTSAAFTAIWGTSPTDIFACSSTTVFHYNGTAWQAMTTNSASSLASIWGSSPTDVFAVGIKGAIIHYPDYAPPSISSVNPNHAAGGETLDITIIGYDLASATSVDLGTGITVNTLTVNSSNRITANLTIETSAGAGPRDVSVTAPGGTATLAAQFDVQGSPPGPPSAWIWIGIALGAFALAIALFLLMRRKPSAQ
jgi:hypothetical protein